MQVRNIATVIFLQILFVQLKEGAIRTSDCLDNAREEKLAQVVEDEEGDNRNTVDYEELVVHTVIHKDAHLLPVYLLYTILGLLSHSKRGSKCVLV